ncbi:peptidoglycan/xylan/chitin deacetylase (PgdA/CDA1 family) [Bradyrhizobium japonicum USDA 38]|uniref:polysaccharide deacetylase family protein n=1 Tax=Bradyrhizobium japonicum TaxID=375 RepID=UPI001364D435|nr:polysaccharide deacetylase family protein [Bradyrhizobium japonicum]MCS3897854.1 peptidoglycan/xylan/chitin deacetylase (PgdA/CDA1 family) [Bradyrhizobium japonicum USDA 38]MCS3940908.1 peptidoglycan/xylan/chitin deacetylase (PgdA/CDA1 family) [Bradyrhizobium japonicum]MCW2217035.1 peptidoglycan/xylan/chitin deacetylase (PgdA/CDA1 family) [Bradyrhizobium japonicum]MCW2341651.1 peptidoglycan/xylan/chitin deacetylase (PgdA/CDA1 family) [Bradyrhizobium japonicum]
MNSLPDGWINLTAVPSPNISLAGSVQPARAEAPAGSARKPPLVRRDISVGPSAKRTTKLTISLFYYLARGLSRFVLGLAGRSPTPKLVILYYHGIPDAYRSNFVRQMESIRRKAQVSPASHRGSLPSGKGNVAITFDDAYVSVAKNALPALTARGFHSTIFVPTGTLGGPPPWSMEDGSPDSIETVMSAEQIATLPSALVTVGAHSRTHPRLSRLAPGDARDEIEGSRHELEDLTTQDVRLFALPYGDHDSSTIDLCRTAGYEAVFTTTPAPVDTTGSDLVRGRVKVDPFDGRLEFFLKYNGAYAWAPYLSALKRRLRNPRSFSSNQKSSLRPFVTYRRPKQS